MFLNSLYASNYNILVALLAPRTPAELTDDELMNTFEVAPLAKEKYSSLSATFSSNLPS
jgi:hypothetical protein